MMLRLMRLWSSFALAMGLTLSPAQAEVRSGPKDGLGAPRRAVSRPDATPAVEPATQPPSLAPHAALRSVTATSTFTSSKDQYAAWRTLVFEETQDDLGAPRTAWCEGKPDEGIGEGITIAFAAPTRLDTIEIAAGVWLTQKWFARNNRITSLAVSFDGKPAIKVKPRASRAWVSVAVGRRVSSIAITIDGVTRGKMNDSCISGVRLYRRGEPVAALPGVDAAAAAALPRALAALYRSLEDPTRAGLGTLLGFPFVLNDSSSWGFSVSTPRTYASARALMAACKAYDAEVAKAHELDEFNELEGRGDRRCPTTPYIKDDNASMAAHIESAGPGRVAIVFPSGREVRDEWQLRWIGGAWKLTAIDFR